MTTLGSYPLVSLKDARTKCDYFKLQLYKGISPVEEKRKKKEQLIKQKQVEVRRTTHTFEKVASDYISSISEEHSYKYISINIGRIKNHILPYIGQKPIEDITRMNVIECLDRLTEQGKLESADRILSLISHIFKYAVTREITSRNITFEIDKRYVIGKREVRHFATITDPQKVGELMRLVDNYHGNFVVKSALKLAIYTAQRPYNIRFAEWSEFDFKKNSWDIPASKMKMKRAHFVPITKQMKAVLDELAPYSKEKSKYLFPSFTSNIRPISENTLNQALRRLSYTKEEIVSHGLRAMFSTLANEHINSHGFHSDIIERHLAHVENNKIRGAYNHAEYYPQRCGLMEWYNGYLDMLKNSTNEESRGII
jgi:integrase